MAAETFDTDNAAGPVGLHEFTMPGTTNWQEVTLPGYTRRFFVQCAADVQLAFFTTNGDGGAVHANDKKYLITADTPWSQPLVKGKAPGALTFFLRDAAGGSPLVYVGAEAYEGG